MKRVLFVYGTRPEAVKLAPLVHRMEASDSLAATIAVTAQHREMLDQVNETFRIVPDFDLGIMQPGQTLVDVTNRTLSGVSGLLREIRPSAVVVQGDTTTTFAASLAAHYEQVPVVHVEAGLRTNHRYSPFPEEMNRRLATQLATLHLAPTATSRDNLLRDGVEQSRIIVTGNTVIDALLWTVAETQPRPGWILDDIAPETKVLVVTAHRRESWGEPLASVGRALARVAACFPEALIVLPVHRNPVVRDSLLPPLEACPNVKICEPLDYVEFTHLMVRSHLILTDSGGIQEEAPSLGKPVLVLRDDTERPEAVEAGCARLVGREEDTIVSAVSHLLNDESAYAAMARVINPYGDGHAAERAVAAIDDLLADANVSLTVRNSSASGSG